MQDKRLGLLEILNNFKTSDAREVDDITKIIQFIEKHENIFSRANNVAHITGSALVVNPVSKKLLLHKHKKLNKWLQFGGHADGETNVSEVAKKEAIEESGLNDLKFATDLPLPIDIELQEIPASEEVEKHFHLDFRYILFTDAEKVSLPEKSESQNLRFFSYDDVDALRGELNPALVRLIEKSKIYLQ